MPSEFASVGPAGQGHDYTNIATWESSEQQNLTTATYIHKMSLYNNSGSQWNALTINGWTVNATYYIDINVPLAERWNGISTTSGCFGYGRYYLQSYTRVQGLVLMYAESYFIGADGNTEILLDGCVVSGAGAAVTRAFNNITYCYNCLAIGGGANHFQGAGSWPRQYNCTSVGVANTKTAFLTATMVNCVARVNSGGRGYTDIWGDSTNCSSSDGTHPATNGSTISDVDFVDYAGGDYSPAVGGLLDGTGVDESGRYTTDILGADRTVPWTRGAFISAVATPTITFDGPAVTNVDGTINVDLPNPSPNPSMDSRFTVVGGTATYALAPTSGVLPAGVTIDSATGNLIGTPSADGTFAGVIVRGTVT